MNVPGNLAALNATVGEALKGLRRRDGEAGAEGVSGAEWVKAAVGRREWRVPCIDVAVRL